jgi:hypothetical protein
MGDSKDDGREENIDKHEQWNGKNSAKLQAVD